MASHSRAVTVPFPPDGLHRFHHLIGPGSGATFRPHQSTHDDRHPPAEAAPLVLCCALGVLCLSWPGTAQPTAPPIALPNDNRQPAGHAADGVLQLSLELREATWQPDHRTTQIPIYAFAETGHAPQDPGPLIRVERRNDSRDPPAQPTASDGERPWPAHSAWAHR